MGTAAGGGDGPRPMTSVKAAGYQSKPGTGSRGFDPMGGGGMGPAPPLDAIRGRCRSEVAALSAGVRRLTDAEQFPVELSAALGRLSRRVGDPDGEPA